MASNQQVLQEAQAVLQRYRAEKLPQQARLMGRRLKRLVATDAAIVMIALIIGMVHPLGTSGIILTLFALLLGSLLAVLTIRPVQPPKVEELQKQPLKLLPDRTATWLSAQKPALPAPARRFADAIGQKLSRLTPAVDNLPEQNPAALQIRKLVSEELPELVQGYVDLPESLRKEAREGMKSPDSQLTAGLDVINQALERIEQDLASHDLDKLATQQ
ncbi:MAG: hypothetical protein ABF416_04600, partial [Zymomonas mobilis subsp. pomaceae]